MSPLAIWLRSHPAERAGLLLLAVLLGLGALGAAAAHLLAPGAGGGSRAPAAAPAAPAAPPSSPAGGPGEAALPPGTAPGALPAPGAPPDVPPPLDTRLPDPQSLAQISAVAGAFMAAFDSYSYSDPPSALRQRLRPYDTDALDQQFGLSSGGAYERQQQAATHQRATASVVSVTPQGGDGKGGVVVQVALRQVVRSDQGGTTQTLTNEILLVPTRAGWRVAQVEV